MIGEKIIVIIVEYMFVKVFMCISLYILSTSCRIYSVKGEIYRENIDVVYKERIIVQTKR